ncbi:MAG: cytochrome c oxidase subunit II [Erythrobacter sp.]
MILGQTRQRAQIFIAAIVTAFLLVFAVQGVAAQEAAGQEAGPQESEAAAVDAGSTGYTPMAPTQGKGMPDGGINFQDQYTEIGRDALFMHDAFLIPMMAGVSLLVLGLILWVVVVYRRKANPEPSRTTHNTAVEVIWTLLPVLILVAIAVPSISLLAKQYETPPEDAVTVKATGYQWYWGYSYPDNGDFEVVSNMLSEADAIANGEPALLAVDNRMVVPANTPIRLQTTAADVIHAFAVPSLWFKLDAVPGRLNERMLIIEEPGVYYGQCSELCGARHGYMPIAVEALPREEWEAWVLEQPGGMVGESATIAEEDAESAQDAAQAGDEAAEVEAEEAESEAA